MPLPIFPLNTLVFPGGVLALRIFETRYLDMVRDCARDNTEFVITLATDRRAAGSPYAKTATAVRIVDWDTLPDGLLGVTVEGMRRVSIADVEMKAEQLLKADVETIAEDEDIPLDETFKAWADLIKSVLTHLGEPYNQLEFQLDSANWVASRMTEVLPLELSVKQKILEINHPAVRLEHLREALKDIEYYKKRAKFINKEQ